MAVLVLYFYCFELLLDILMMLVRIWPLQYWSLQYFLWGIFDGCILCLPWFFGANVETPFVKLFQIIIFLRLWHLVSIRVLGIIILVRLSSQCTCYHYSFSILPTVIIINVNGYHHIITVILMTLHTSTVFIMLRIALVIQYNHFYTCWCNE